jgi:hypothetical protein
MFIAAHALIRRWRSSVRPPVLVLVLHTVTAAAVFGCQADKPNSQADAAASAGDASDVSPPSDAAASTPVCAAATDPVDPTALIDDFEGGATNLLPTIGGRVGGWYSIGDGTAAAVLSPSGVVTPEAITGGRCASRHALHLTGGGFLDWGAQLLTPLSYGANDAGAASFLPYDGSRYRGITFFARIGDTSSASVRFSVADEYARPEAGLCVLGGAFGTGCYDSTGVDLAPSLTTEWRQFHIPFAGLAPRNIGLHSATGALDTSKIYDLEFNFASNVIFDFWVDDISFY